MPLDARLVNRYFRDGKPVHIRVEPGTVAPIALLPGDPGRVQRIAGHLSEADVRWQGREYTLLVGEYEGQPVTVCSTGIGGPSTEIAVLELAALGVTTFIRVGGTGSLHGDIPVGTVVMNTGMVRAGGASVAYAPPEYPAVAHPEVLMSLMEAAHALDIPYRVGIGASTGSYYQGQGRELFDPPGVESPLTMYRRLGVLNLEMETETIFTLAGLLGLRAGAVCGVHANRDTDTWDPAYEETQDRVIRIALRAAVYLGSSAEGGTARGVCPPPSRIGTS